MSELYKSFANIRTLRAMSRDVSVEQMEALLEKVKIVLEEKREHVKAQELESEKVRERLSKYEAMLDEDNITPEQLVELLGGGRADGRRLPRPAKYRFIDENGNEKTWTGQGRMPRALQKAVSEGQPLETFAI